MKKFYTSLWVCCLYYAAAAQTGNWTWESGDNVSDQYSVYGVRGVAAARNKPGARQSSVSWKDATGNLWLLGGYGLDSKNRGYLNDLWRYNPSTNVWTWINGDSSINRTGIYGSKNISNAQNKPGARSGAVSWVDAAGNFWLFGGEGYDAQVPGNPGLLNDLWRYNPATNLWTWISGITFANQGGAYGIKNVAIPSNRPGARYGSTGWADPAGNLWLYGGLGNDSTVGGYLGDLWQFNITTNLWTWVSGDNRVNTTASRGTKGVAAPANKPGSRQNALSWFDESGSLWLFGGFSKYDGGLFNDLWKFDRNTGQWIWVSGDNIAEVNGVYGTKGIAAATNKPGSRQSAIGWKDVTGNLWLFGGQVHYGETFNGSASDLWKYETRSNQWTWVSGDNVPGQGTVYGSRGVGSPANKPGPRWGSISWTDGAGSFWQFGGTIYSAEFYPAFNHLWKFDPVFLSCPPSITVSADSNTCSAVVKNIDPVFTGGTQLPINFSISGATSASGSNTASGHIFLRGTSTVGYRVGTETQSSCSFTVAVVDKTPPVLKVLNLPDMTAECLTTVTTIPTAIDNCGETIRGTTTDPLTYRATGTYTVNWVYADSSGNTNTQRQLVIIKDVTPPVPVLKSLPDIIAECMATVKKFPTATDNCNGTVVGSTTNPMSYSAKGSYTINWIYKDSSGNATTQQQQVIVKDTTAPLPTIETLPGITIDCSTVISPPTAVDNCSGTIRGTTTTEISFAGDGVYILTWMYKDSSGNTSTQLQQATVRDRTAPVPDTQSLPDLTAECSLTVPVAPTAFVNCSGTIKGITADPVSYNTQGIFVINWVYKDSGGNSTIQRQQVIIRDRTAPVPKVQSLPDILGDCSATVVTSPTATDNCNGTINGLSSDPMSFTKQGSYIITWTYKDSSGNSTTQQQRVVIQDKIPPVPTITSLPDISGECSVTVSAHPTAADNCNRTITGVTSSPLSYTKQGNYIITWLYRDSTGNTTSQQQQVIVRDHTPPVVHVASLPDIIGECTASVTASPIATDNCSGIITGITTDRQSYNTQGTRIITWTFRDSSGNVTTQQQRIVVKDISAPVPNLAVLPNITAECSAAVTAIPTATDNCMGSIIGTTDDPKLYDKGGTYTINWKYSDTSGNITIQKQQVIIKTSVGPTPLIAAIPDITAECSATITNIPMAKDRCGNLIKGTTTNSLHYTTVGKHVISWTFTDASGNSAVQKQNVTVVTLDLILNVFPNPTHNEFNILIKSCDLSRIITLNIYDMMGRQVFVRDMIKPNQIVSFGNGLPGGTYILLLKQGSQAVTRKVIKAK